MAYKMTKLPYGYSKYMDNYNNMMDYYSNLKKSNVIYADTKLLLVYFSQYMANFQKKNILI